MATKSTYDMSTIDWVRLRRFAKRVAEETPLPPEGPLEYTVLTQKTVTRIELQPSGFLGLGRPKEVKVSQVQAVSESITVVGQHWTLSTRTWNHEMTRADRNGSKFQEETNSSLYLWLLLDGSLQSGYVTRTSVRQFGGPFRANITPTTTTHHCGDVSESDILKLDFERYYREFKERDGNLVHHYWTDRDPGRKLLKHAKGVGVNLALKAILEGRQPTGT